MSENYYNLDGIITQLNKRIEETEAKLEAWKAVNFPTKKDGTPFKQMSKNISGATYYVESWAMQPGEYRLRVNTWSKTSGYVSDDIGAHDLVKYIKDEHKKSKTENYMPKQAYLEQVYVYDLEDIKEAIKNRINYFEIHLISLKEQREKASEIYKNFVSAYKAALSQLEKDANKNEDSTLYYMVLDTVKERFPYC